MGRDRDVLDARHSSVNQPRELVKAKPVTKLFA